MENLVMYFVVWAVSITTVTILGWKKSTMGAVGTFAMSLLVSPIGGMILIAISRKNK